MKFTEWDISTFITWEIRDGDTVPIYLLDFYNRITNVDTSIYTIFSLQEVPQLAEKLPKFRFRPLL